MKSLNEWKELFEQELLNHPSDDGSHDLGHFRRVWKMASNFIGEEGDQEVVLAASYFHDIVNYPKNDPRRSQSSRDAALKASEILERLDFNRDKIPAVCHAIEAHSFSAGIDTKTLEAMAVQDADRMEALGAIGLARTFYVAGRMGSQIFNSEDPFAKNRSLDDKKYSVDHFYTKLLKLEETMKTEAGKQEARKRTQVLSDFLKVLGHELES